MKHGYIAIFLAGLFTFPVCSAAQDTLFTFKPVPEYISGSRILLQWEVDSSGLINILNDIDDLNDVYIRIKLNDKKILEEKNICITQDSLIYDVSSTDVNTPISIYGELYYLKNGNSIEVDYTGFVDSSRIFCYLDTQIDKLEVALSPDVEWLNKDDIKNGVSATITCNDKGAGIKKLLVCLNDTIFDSDYYSEPGHAIYIPLEKLNEGENTLSITAYDNSRRFDAPADAPWDSNNCNTRSVQASINIDTSPPAAEILIAHGNNALSFYGRLSSDESLKILFSDNMSGMKNVQCVLYQNGAIINRHTWSLQKTDTSLEITNDFWSTILESGNYELEITVSDICENTSEHSYPVFYIKHIFKAYPNPVKDGTCTFEITDGIIQKIEIYDTWGYHVKTLNNQSNQHRISWDCTNDKGQKVAAGLYICILDGNERGAFRLAVVR